MSSECLKTSKSKIHRTRGYHRLPTNINKSKMKHVDLCRALLEHSTPATENMFETITIEAHQSELRTMLNDDPHRAITQFCKNIRISDLKASKWYGMLATPKPRTKQGLCAGIRALSLPPPQPPSPRPFPPPRPSSLQLGLLLPLLPPLRLRRVVDQINRFPNMYFLHPHGSHVFLV